MSETGAGPVHDEKPSSAPARSRLFRKYALLIGALVSGVLILSGATEIWFSYQEAKSALLHVQREKAVAAAAVIDRFIKEIEGQMGWTMHANFLTPEAALRQRRFDFLRLLRQAPEITEIAYIDPFGKEQLRVSRLAIDVVGSGKDFVNDPKFRVVASPFDSDDLRAGRCPRLAGRRAGIVQRDVVLGGAAES